MAPFHWNGTSKALHHENTPFGKFLAQLKKQNSGTSRAMYLPFLAIWPSYMAQLVFGVQKIKIMRDVCAVTSFPYFKKE